MEKLGENVKKLLLAGIGAAAVTAEKSKELLDEMVKKGELTVEQGKVLNEELKHNIKKTVQENVHKTEKQTSEEAVDALLEKLSPEQMEELKRRLQCMEEACEKDEDTSL
jgi:polyhydroxyalkanoate synthesis regulator phasin|nr:hypothetical protein [uncultured Faecalimonas sp.]